MKKKLSAFLFFVPFMVSSCLSAFAQNAPQQSPVVEKKMKPISVNYTTLSGLSYTSDDTFLLSYKDFEELIYPLRDFEINRLLKKSESSDEYSRIFSIAGFGGLVTGLIGILITPSNQQTPFWVTAIGGAVSFDIAGLFHSEAQTTKFNCIQRYNRFARGEEQVLPREPEDEKSLLNFDKTGNPPANKPVINKKSAQ